MGYEFVTGLTLEDFGKETQGEMVIEFLQMKHKCVIAVQDSSADTRYNILLYVLNGLNSIVTVNEPIYSYKSKPLNSWR